MAAKLGDVDHVDVTLNCGFGVGHEQPVKVKFLIPSDVRQPGGKVLNVVTKYWAKKRVEYLEADAAEPAVLVVCDHWWW